MSNFEKNYTPEQNELRYDPEGLKQDFYYVVQWMNWKETPFSIATLLIENIEPEHKSLVRHQMSELESFPIIRPGDIIKINDNIQVLINGEVITEWTKEVNITELQPIMPDGSRADFKRKVIRKTEEVKIDRKTPNLYKSENDNSRGRNLYDASKDKSK